MTRIAIARHFHSITAISREELFGVRESRYRPVHLPLDASTMFAGYVGDGYVPGNGILLLAINPGGGGDAYDARTREDEVFYPLLSAFKECTKAETEIRFENVNSAFAQIVQAWNL
jgi:hypothetical protein